MLVDEAAILRKLNWAILPICCIMIGCCYLDRSNVAYMQLQLRRPPPVGLSFSSSLYGNASGLFFLSYSLFQIPSSIVVARLGAPLWLAVIVTLWGVSAMLLVAIRTGGHFLLLRILLGAFEAGTFPGMWYHMTLFYPVKDLTIPLSATSSSIMVAQVLSAPLAAALMSLHGALGLRGWQWIALAEGGLTVAIGVIVKFALPASPAHMKSLSPAEAAWVQAHVSTPATTEELLVGLRKAATSRALWQLTAILTAKSFAIFSLMFWIPVVVSDLLHRSGTLPNGVDAAPSAATGGVDAEESDGTTHDLTAVLLTAVPYAFAAITSYLIGWSSHAWDERRAHTYIPFGVGAATLLSAPLLQGPSMAVPSFVALTVAISLCNSTAPLTAALAACLPPEAQAGGLALYNAVAGIGGYLGPAVFGWLKDTTGSNAPGMVANGFVLLLGALLMWAFDERAARAAAGPSHALAARPHDADTAKLLPLRELHRDTDELLLHGDTPPPRSHAAVAGDDNAAASDGPPLDSRGDRTP